MNVFFVVAASLSLFSTVGHVVIGTKSFLSPMMGAEFAAIPKKVIHCVFHFITAYFAVSTLVYAAAGFGLSVGMDLTSALYLATAQYIAIAAVQIAMVLASGIKGGLLKIFQWTFFVAIGAFGLLGLLL